MWIFSCPSTIATETTIAFSSVPLSDSYVDHCLRTTKLEDIELGETMGVITRIEIKGWMKDIGIYKMVTQGDRVAIVTYKSPKMIIP